MKTKVWLLVAAGAIAWVLKRHYADARADELSWVLAPTARLVGAVTGTTFVPVPAEGYFSPDRLFLIEKSCAGVNFMIAAFGTLAIALIHRVRGAATAAGVIAVSLLAAYAATVGVNAVRIAIAMWLAAHRPALWALDAADVHRLEGITVYFGGLVLLYEAARYLDRRAAVRCQA